MVTSDTATIFLIETSGSYENIDEISESPTKASIARSNPLAFGLGLTKRARTIQNNKAKLQAVCVAAIEIGADNASKKRLTCNARVVYISILFVDGIWVYFVAVMITFQPIIMASGIYLPIR